MAAQTKRYKTKDKDNSELQEDAVVVIVFVENQIQANLWPTKRDVQKPPTTGCCFCHCFVFETRQRLPNDVQKEVVGTTAEVWIYPGSGFLISEFYHFNNFPTRPMTQPIIRRDIFKFF